MLWQTCFPDCWFLLLNDFETFYPFNVFSPYSVFCYFVTRYFVTLFSNVCWGQILHCLLPSKTVHRRLSFPRVAFLRRLCRPLLDISCCWAQQTFSVQWLLYSENRFLNDFATFLVLWIRGTPALWKFDKVLRFPSTFLCAPCSLLTQNGLCSVEPHRV